MRALPRRHSSPGRIAAGARAGRDDWVGRRREENSAGNGAGNARRLNLRFGANGVQRDSFRDGAMELIFMSEQTLGPSALIPIPQAPVPAIPPAATRREIEVTIDGERVSVPEGATILEATRKLGIDTPTLCFLETLTPVNACRVCVVELEGARTLVPACSRTAEAGMISATVSEHALPRPLPVLDDHPPCRVRSTAPPILSGRQPCGSQPERPC